MNRLQVGGLLLVCALGLSVAGAIAWQAATKEAESDARTAQITSILTGGGLQREVSADRAPAIVMWVLAGVSAVAGAILLILHSTGAGLTTLDRIQARPATAGWFDDPLGRFDVRRFDGARWTQHVGRRRPDGCLDEYEDPV